MLMLTLQLCQLQTVRVLFRYVFVWRYAHLPRCDQVFVLFRPLRDRALKAPTAQFRQPLPILALDGDSSVFGVLNCDFVR